MNRHRSVLLCVLALSLLALAAPAAAYQWPASLDAPLRRIIQEHGLIPREPGPRPIAAQVRLGESLFFDKILSGNRDIACATCHHPSLATGDALALPIGTGGSGLGPDRVIGAGRPFIPRNAPEVFNRAFPGWTSMFWDSRIQQHPDGSFTSPAGADLPAGLHNVLAVQALFPVTSADEMRGAPGDRDVFGQPNELALIPADDRPAIWDALMQRLLAIPEYEALFRAAYPTIPAHELGFEHAATAIAAFEGRAYTLRNSPWDRYLRGDDRALTEAAKRGSLVFFGKAGCATCHSGALFTDQQHYNLAVPQLGPGKGAEAPLDLGRARETGDPADRFAFRTPPLRNVTMSGPYMHNGAFRTLDAAVRHHLDPEGSLRSYDVTAHLPPALQATFQRDPELLAELLATVDPVAPPEPLSDAEFADMLAFLAALTDPAVTNLPPPPERVPSGLPVADTP